MGLFDKAKELAGQHADKVGDAIDKAADVVDDKTGGRYSQEIEKGTDAAKGFVDGEAAGGAGETEPPSRPPS